MPEIHPKIGRYLVISATPGAELPSEVAQDGDEVSLDGRVNILVLRFRPELAAADAAGHVG
ncbi:unannotated protein [freshwater metagenome]|uniref:Unannotated protein n=1 Tax=freshwater metagenome TaxID=449393 RepID=A0A6J7HNT6_9ZZZZ